MKAKLILLFSAVLITLMGINSCKKDYPKDTPDWLKEIIKQRKKQCKTQCQCNDGSGLCWTISEYSNNGEIKYVIIEGQISTTKTVDMRVYSLDGQLICNTTVIEYPQSLAQCDNVLQTTFNRIIWKESY
jgi:hypothetical protein